MCIRDRGAEDKIISRDAKSLFPASLAKIPEVAEASYKPNLELIIESNPDVVIADSMLKDEMREKIEAAGIPVLVYVTSEVETLPKMIEDLGTVLGKKEQAQEMIDFSNKYYKICLLYTSGDCVLKKIFLDWVRQADGAC